MILTNGRVVCDHRSQRLPDIERGCNRTAVVQRRASSGAMLHYCRRHKSVAANPRPENFTPAPSSVVLVLKK